MFLIGLFMVLVIVGLGVIHYELKMKAKNDERIIQRLDIIISELRNEKDP